MQRSQPLKGQIPERGVVEVKPAAADAWLAAAGDQVSRYWDRYRLVLVTNLRDFVLVGEDGSGRPSKLGAFRLADSVDHFNRRLERPRAFASVAGAGAPRGRASVVCRDRWKDLDGRPPRLGGNQRSRTSRTSSSSARSWRMSCRLRLASAPVASPESFRLAPPMVKPCS